MPESSRQQQLVNAEFTLESEHFRLTSKVTVPAGPAQVSDILPVARDLSDAIVRVTCQAVEKAGDRISCSKGCGACCRNIVAISEVEARQIRKLVQRLPEPRRSVVLARFAAAQLSLDRAGILEKLRAADGWSPEDYTAMVGAYFEQGVPCPFLEQESCSIYDERPITCREYLVTSPPEYCARLDSGEVRQVRLFLRVFNAVARWQVVEQGPFLERWVPLILAPEWAEAHPDDPPPKPGPELLRELLAHLSNK